MTILEKIYESTLKFLSPLDSEETYRIIIEEAIGLIGGNNGRIFLFDGRDFRCVYNSSDKMPIFEPRKRGNVYISFSKKKAFIVYEKEVKKTYPKLKSSGVRSIMYIPLVNQGVAYGVIVIRSRKDQKFKQSELTILKLFGSLASMSIRKTQLYEEVRKALETRDLFISLASHELRTPLTTLNGYVQLLLNKMNNKKKIEKKWILELAFESQRLKNLINEFLEINRIKTGKLQYDWQECRIRDVVNRSVTNFKFNYPTRKLVLKDKLGSMKDKVIADPDKLAQVFDNVLENANKYSPANRKILLHLAYVSSFFILEIEDEGQGIKEKDLPQVFEGFYKGENSLHEGMGLGLFLSKNIIDSHRGEISMQSKINKGTRVRIKIPRMEKND